jgi:hypothetical protein
MGFIFRSARWLSVLAVLGFVAWFCVAKYSFVFSKKIVGVVVGIEKVTTNFAVIQSAGSPASPQMFSYAVAIKDKNGEIHTASSEDRQWAVVEKGKCIEAKYYPYPPWDLEKGGTYFNARLDRMFECEK